MTVAISNPPYNLKWSAPPFAELQERFKQYGVPPEANANYAFILSSILNAEKGVFILPNGALTSNNVQEREIVKNLVENNYIEAIIACPGSMFEKTSISTVILKINKSKNDDNIVFVDLRNSFEVEQRKQKGQFGGASHTNRVYKKSVNVFSQETIEKTVNVINKRIREDGFSEVISIEEVRKNDYVLIPSRYIEVQIEVIRRDIKDIVRDLNLIIKDKNCCKMTINITIAKSLGFDEKLYKKPDNSSLNKVLKKIGSDEIVNENYISFSKNAGELKFENGDKTNLSSILIMILNSWKTHIHYLNTKENMYLGELRDALLQKLMSGDLELEDIKEVVNDE